MAYQQFTIAKLKKQFGLSFVESRQAVVTPVPTSASEFLNQTIERNLDLALGVGTEKIRSELIVAPLLVEVREHYNRQISVFSGKEFNVDEDAGLNGYCDFLISGSSELLEISAPVLVVVEAKQDVLNSGIPQCVAAMIASQQFNESHGNAIPTMFGASTTGKLWKFLALQSNTVSVDLTEYALPPIDAILSFLVAMAACGNPG